jgi:hypothetical protein
MRTLLQECSGSVKQLGPISPLFPWIRGRKCEKSSSVTLRLECWESLEAVEEALDRGPDLG